MSSIQQRGTKFQLRLDLKSINKPTFRTFDTREEAEGYRDKMHGLEAQGYVPVDLLEKTDQRGEHIRLTTVIDQYIELGSPAKSDAELLGYMKRELANERIGDVDFQWGERYVKGLKLRDEVFEGPRGRRRRVNLSPGTIRKRVGSLTRVLEWYHRRKSGEGYTSPLRWLPRGYSSYSEAEAAAAPVGAKRDRERDVRVSPEAEFSIRAALHGVKRPDKERALKVDPAFILLWDLILDTGLRLSEAYKLRTDQVDSTRGILRVEGSKGHRGVIKPRTVPLKKPLRAALKVWCEQLPAGLVFPFWSGDPRDLKRVSMKLSVRFAVLFEYAGHGYITEHDMRHEACCRWVLLRRADGGWVFSDIEICKIMGWKDTRMMLRYASLRGEDLADRLL